MKFKQKAYLVALNTLLGSRWCGGSKCHFDAECQLIGNGNARTCACKNGFYGDGMNCLSGEISKFYLANLDNHGFVAAFGVQAISTLRT